MTISRATIAILLFMTALVIAPSVSQAQQMDCGVTKAYTAIKHGSWNMHDQLVMQAIYLGYWDANGNWVLNHNAYAQPDSPFTGPIGSVWTSETQTLNPPYYFFWAGGASYTYGPHYISSYAECSAACETIPGVDACLYGGFGFCTALKYKPGINPASFTYVPSPPGGQTGNGLDFPNGGYGVSTCVPVTPKADLTAGAITPVVATAGTPATYAATLSNVAVAAGASQTRFQWATSAAGAGATTIGDTATAAIAAGGSAVASRAHTFASAGTYYMRACADATSVVEESEENNNCGAWTAVTVSAAPVGADLTAGAITPTTATLGQSKALSGTISNIGGTAAGASRSYFQVTAPNAKGNTTSVVNTPALAAAAGSNASFNYTFSYVGTYSVRACADWYGEVTESNEANNCGPWTDIVVIEAPIGSSVSCTVSPSSAVVGGSVTYTAHPVGAATAPYSWTGSDGATGFGTNSTAVRTFSAPGTYGMQVSATNVSGSVQCPLISVGAGWCTAAATDLTITATPARVRSGQSTTLTWNATGVNGQNATCSVSGPGVSWTSSVTTSPSCSASGTATTVINTQSTYTLTCNGVSKSVTVNVIPNFIEF